MHDLNIVHLDLKTDNIVFDTQTKQIFIIDFGHSEKVKPQQKISGIVGTTGFRAPEVSKGNIYDPIKADIWSLGEIIKRLGLVCINNCYVKNKIFIHNYYYIITLVLFYFGTIASGYTNQYEILDSNSSMS